MNRCLKISNHKKHNGKKHKRNYAVKKILVIGSAVADVIIDLEDHLPRTGEDVHVRSQEMRMGGCAYNTFDIIRLFQVPCIPFFPVGQGAYGDYIFREFTRRGINSPVPRPAEENGCCYCFIEPDGERTFISYHGTEYRFRKEWFSLLDVSQIHSIYFCGLEIEEPTGPAIVDFLEEHPAIPAFFAPGPRLTRIDPALMRRIFKRSPILHLNKSECLLFTGEAEIEEAAKKLYAMTGNTVIITLGADGCAWYDETSSEGSRILISDNKAAENEAGLCPSREPCPDERVKNASNDSVNHKIPGGLHIVPGIPAKQIDTVGAGDAHIGAIMAALYLGYTLPAAIETANKVSARVIGVHGANLTAESFARLDLPVCHPA